MRRPRRPAARSRLTASPLRNVRRHQALVAITTRESFVKPSGILAQVDVASKAVDTDGDLGGQPDSIALNKDKMIAAIAIENERDEEVNDGAIPQMPAGDLVILSLKDGIVDCGSIKHVTLTGLADVAGDDPEPEFVAFNGLDEIALTLQENNYIVIVDGKTGDVKATSRLAPSVSKASTRKRTVR